MDELKLIVLDNIKEFGEDVEKHLNKINYSNNNYIIPIRSERFANGEGKVKIDGTLRDKDIYILSDVGNYNISYKMHGKDHIMGPDEHFQDIKRVISAINGQASKINVVMPLLYASRQHRKKGKESSDCVQALQELEGLGVRQIITFDAHDPNVANSIPNTPFDNFYVAHEILSELIDNEDIRNLLVISPDFGAMERTRYFAEMLGSDVGVFYKRRDLSKVVNGKNPIVAHDYMGKDVNGKNIIVVDDMIASGSSMIDVARDLKEKGAKNVYLVATFNLLTEGPEIFRNAYKKGLFDKLYSTNLTYVPNEVKKEAWYHEVDITQKAANIINTIHKGESLKPLFNGKQEIFEKLEKKYTRTKK